MPRSKRYGLLDRLDSLIHRRILPVRHYPTWELAERAAGDADGYASAIMNEFRIARRAGLDQAAYDPLLAGFARDGCRVTDFGGSTGDLGDLLTEQNPSIRYTVVENPVMVGLMQKQETRVHFTTTIPDECDIFYSSSTLHYVRNPYDVLQKGFKSAAHYVILVRNNFADVEKFMVHRSRLYDNGSGPLPAGFENLVMRCPMRTVQESKIRDIALSFKFSPIVEKRDTGLDHKGGYSMRLVFERHSTASA
jgi:putative methyltransferase (TIGR04325 family)